MLQHPAQGHAGRAGAGDCWAGDERQNGPRVLRGPFLSVPEGHLQAITREGHQVREVMAKIAAAQQDEGLGQSSRAVEQLNQVTQHTTSCVGAWFNFE